MADKELAKMLLWTFVGVALLETVFSVPLILRSYLTIEDRELVVRYGGVLPVRYKKEEIQRVKSTARGLEITYSGGKMTISDCPEPRKLFERLQLPVR